MSATSVTTDQSSLVRFCNGARVLAECLVVPRDGLGPLAERCRAAGAADEDELSRALRDLADSLAEADELEFAKAYTRLFLGPFTVPLPPYASWFLDPEQRMMGPVAEAVARVYAEADCAPGDGIQELPDHISVQLEFCYLLGYRALEEDDETALAVLRAFWLDRLVPWLPSLAREIQDHGNHPALTSLANGLRALEAQGMRCFGTRKPEAAEGRHS